MIKRIIRILTALDGTTAEIKQINRRDYSLAITSRQTGHCRFGTLTEIEQDAEFFARAGRLPVCRLRVF